MSTTSADPTTHSQLRQKAELSIRGGHAPTTQGWTIGPASLLLLHRLASDPATASDALKLLHELQVHQVELDMQHENMNDERLVLEQSTRRMVEMYMFAPVAYFLVATSGQIIEGNLAGARMLGVPRDDVESHNITRLAAPGSRDALLALLAQVHGSGQRHSCQIEALDIEKTRFLEVIADAPPGGQHCLVVITNVAINTDTDTDADADGGALPVLPDRQA